MGCVLRVRVREWVRRAAGFWVDDLELPMMWKDSPYGNDSGGDPVIVSDSATDC